MEIKVKIIRLDDDMDHLEHELDAFLDSFSMRGNDIFRVSSKKWRPPCDVLETDKAFVLRMEIAGMDPKGFNILYQARRIIISGRREHWPKEDAHYRQLELNSGYFERTIMFPMTVDPEKIKAGYNDGVLEIHLPKAEGKEQSKREITID